MRWYLEALKKYATFSGRASRAEYWWFVLFNLLFGIAVGVLDVLLGTVTDDGTGVLGTLYTLAILLPGIAVAIRRLHDTDRSGWHMLLAFVPLANIVLLAFFLEDGTPGPNRYGPDPKGRSSAAGSPSQTPAGWYRDPTGRHQLRYWDSQKWTQHVSDDGLQRTDPM
ncbi:MAG: DUF805 domain-containing protein [Anaerosomatales bacterium]|nr:DUF805 domain-containing protein [Anaerosomatales bacterium]